MNKTVKNFLTVVVFLVVLFGIPWWLEDNIHFTWSWAVAMICGSIMEQ